MSQTAPTIEQIKKLTTFLPVLSAKGFTPIHKWLGGEKNADGVMQMPWPEYDPVVDEFVHLASQDCWTDSDYLNGPAKEMINDPALMAKADLTQIKSVLTYFVRGERFVDGHWGSLIESGAVIGLLKRLAEIESQMD